MLSFICKYKVFKCFKSIQILYINSFNPRPKLLLPLFGKGNWNWVTWNNPQNVTMSIRWLTAKLRLELLRLLNKYLLRAHDGQALHQVRGMQEWVRRSCRRKAPSSSWTESASLLKQRESTAQRQCPAIGSTEGQVPRPVSVTYPLRKEPRYIRKESLKRKTKQTKCPLCVTSRQAAASRTWWPNERARETLPRRGS